MRVRPEEAAPADTESVKNARPRTEVSGERRVPEARGNVEPAPTPRKGPVVQAHASRLKIPAYVPQSSQRAETSAFVPSRDAEASEAVLLFSSL